MAKEQRITASTPHRFRMRDGVELAADVAGDPEGPFVVMLHGQGQTREAWSATMRTLAQEGYRVINYDARGHGESDWALTGDYSLEAGVQDLHDITNGINRPIALIGASFGGIVSMYFAGRDCPDLISALILVDIVPRPELAGAARIRKFMTANLDGFSSLEEAVEVVSAYNLNRSRPSDSTGLMKNLRLREDGKLYWHWDPKILEQEIESGDVLVEICQKIVAPTMLVRGLKSDLVSEESVKEFKEVITDLEVLDVADAGHMIAGDKNDIFSTATSRFLMKSLKASSQK